jgi:hypothetical protein
MKIHYWLFIIVLFTITSCKKLGEPGVGNSSGTTGTTGITGVTVPADLTAKDNGVYIAGINGIGNTQTLNYWKDSVSISLQNSSKPQSIGAAITSQGKDLYIAGCYTAVNNISVAAYWKNGVINKLTDSLSNFFTTGITVEGSDVYVSGYSLVGLARKAKYWKNGILFSLNDGSKYTSIANGIAINGSDIYVIGNIGDNINNTTAVYWKNNILTKLPDAGMGFSTAKAIALSGNDFYIVGEQAGKVTNSSQTSNSGIYWKNGVITPIVDNNSSCSAITLVGQDVYIAGISNTTPYNKTVATYWKNGIPTQLTDSNTPSNAYGIAINGTDVHVVGDIPYGKAMYWKNGTHVSLNANSNSTAYEVTIVSH